MFRRIYYQLRTALVIQLCIAHFLIQPLVSTITRGYYDLLTTLLLTD